MRYNLYRSAQINGSAAPGYSSAQATAALEDVFAKPCRRIWAMIPGHVLPGKKRPRGRCVPRRHLRPFAVCSSSSFLAALYESWSLPFSVLLGTPSRSSERLRRCPPGRW